MEPLIVVNAVLAGLFAFAAIHYAIAWWFSRDERVFLLFSIQCGTYFVFCSIAFVSYFQARTVAETQAALDALVTVGVIAHLVVLHLYAQLSGRRDRAYRLLVSGALVFLVVLNQWAPLRGTVIELQTVQLPGGSTSLVPIRTPPGVSLAFLYLAVLAVYGYGLFVVRTTWERDRVGSVLVAIASSATLLGSALAFLVDFANVRAPYPGALPHAIFVVVMALYLSREYAARGHRLATSERRAANSLRETQQALVDLEAETRRREESEAARGRALEALVQAQRKDLASHLAAGVAHDFNNVLLVISVWSRGLLDGSLAPKDREKARQGLTDAQAQGQALSRQLMALARPESRSVKRFPLDRPIRTTAQTLTPALPRNIQFACDAPNALEVEADETEIQQVIYNLVLNARDAMPDGGTIQVTGGIETSSTPIAVVGGTLAPGRWVTLSVTDNGPGVDPTIRERIFDLFFTTKDQDGGTGLGLATVLRIARTNGGGVALESTPGSGTTFKIYLPACEQSEARWVSENGNSRLPEGGEVDPVVGANRATQ